MGRLPLLVLALAPGLTLAQTAVRISEPAVPDWDTYTCRDAHERSIVFFLSKAPNTRRLPVALVIEGSGAQSVWKKAGEQVAGGIQNLLVRAAKADCRVIVVEKPGIDFLYQGRFPGTADGAPRRFLEEHTLPRWAEANAAALRAVLKLPEIDPDRVLVVGHSEGGLVAARMAATMPAITHVASLAGGGPNQLFDLMMHVGDRALATWREIQKDPNSVEKTAYGHPYRRWSSFLATSVVTELRKTKAFIYLAQGGVDPNVHPATFEVALAELTAAGAKVDGERLPKADHGFAVPGDPEPYTGFLGVLSRVIDWFFATKR